MKANPDETITIRTSPTKQSFEGEDRLAIITLDVPAIYPMLLTDVAGTAIRGWCNTKPMAVEVARRWVLDGNIESLGFAVKRTPPLRHRYSIVWETPKDDEHDVGVYLFR